MPNPTLDPDEYSRTIIEETIRPGVESYLAANFDDPRNRTDDTTPPLVLTELPGGGRVAYPHVVVSEDGDDASRPDQRLDFNRHDFSVGIEIHGQTATQMFNLRGAVRGWFLRNRDVLRDAGLAEPELSGNPADWDSESQTSSWELTVSGLLHTHPNTS